MSDQREGRWRLTRDLDSAEWVSSTAETTRNEFQDRSFLDRVRTGTLKLGGQAQEMEITHRQWLKRFPSTGPLIT